MRKYSRGLTLAGIAALLLSACGGGGGGGGSSSSSSSSSGGGSNVAPIASAGTNQTVTSGVTVTLNGTASSDPDGSVAGYAWSQTSGAPTVTLSSGTTSQPTFPAPTVTTAATLTFSLVVTDNRGATSPAASVNVTVNPAAGSNVNVTGAVTFARVPFAATGNRGLDYANPVQRPARGVTVRAKDAGTQAVLATGSTDETGNYTLSVASNTTIAIEVVARLQRTGTPSWDVRAQDGISGNSPYTYALAGSFNSSAGGSHNVAIPTGISAAGVAPGARPSGPFAALDTIYQGMQTILGVAPNTIFPALIVDWGSQADGTFFTAGGGQHIALLSDLTKDTDEFDQHVVAHEFGHYIEHNFSRADNIGGAHGLGDMLDIRVAFGEGFGYAFAAMVLNDPIARDSYFDGTLQRSGSFNVETNPPTGSDDQACWCSESSVWSLLWDLYDANADANDTLALGFGPLWSVLIGAQKDTPAFTSVFSFVSALKAARPADAAAIDTLVAAQQITTAGIDAFATTESHFVPGVSPLASLPLYTNISVGAGPVTIATTDDAGHHNKLGTHRYFRFTPTSPGTVNISVSSSNPSNPDPDFRVFRAGTPVLNEEDPPPQPETGSLTVAANTTYVLDVYDCANGCDTVQGTAGDFSLTVTIN